MQIIRQILDWMRDVNNSDWGQLISFLGMMTGIFSMMKWSFLFLKKHSHSVKGYVLMAIIIFLGLIWPVLTLVSTNWIGWKHILLNLLAIYGLFSFIMLLYIIRRMMSAADNKCK